MTGPATLTLRPSTPADFAAIDSMLARSYPALLKAAYPPSVMVTAVPLLSRAKAHLVASGRYFVAEAADGSIVGAGGWSVAARGWAEMRHFAVDPRKARTGIGSALIDHVLTHARDAGYGRVHCLASRNAVPFYEANGFVCLDEVEISLAPGISFPAVRMLRA